MKGAGIIESLVGEELRDGTIQSYFYENELQDLVYKTYLKFANKWIEVIITDGVIVVRLCDENVANYKEYGSDEYKYTTEKFSVVFPEFRKYISHKLLYFKEIVSKYNEKINFGISLYFSNDLVITIFNNHTGKNEIVFRRIEKKDFKEI
ncbi:hypothetical protein [Chryseobacterium sp. 3008163]|uniref:hypothetical protein n=1 Tax=Chryseobacterium sp. 3008163 TaxID=2478663 RepID=UPI000F0C1C71|nr:hypothetical protein [Chryseobacterium sp. 3008163]AYN00814.1 hypothetical protein EAG08_11250 [Chryseobacterium sp. 3008163]